MNVRILKKLCLAKQNDVNVVNRGHSLNALAWKGLRVESVELSV